MLFSMFLCYYFLLASSQNLKSKSASLIGTVGLTIGPIDPASRMAYVA